MRSFLKHLLATMVGIILSGLLLMLILIGVVVAALNRGERPVEVQPNSLLVLRLDQPIVDRASPNPLEGFDFVRMRPAPQLGLNHILKAIEAAAQDPRIAGIYMENSVIPAGAATVEEIRNALIRFRESGKFIVSHSDLYTQTAYYLASVADWVFMSPEGMMAWGGLSSQVLFFTNALEKLGIEPQVIRHGKFKSAAEPFTRERLSPENREQIATYVGSIWSHWLQGISAHRGVSVGQLNAWADGLSVVTARDAHRLGMVDSLVYKDQVLDKLRALTHTPPDMELAAVEVAEYAQLPVPSPAKGFTKDKIAVIYAAGEIVMGDAEDATIAGERFARTLREVRRDSAVRAVVLRVNSPGGSAMASEVIWREVYLTRQVKPVVVSMGDVAASGGYYIAASADHILASPSTITGSIGVFGLHLDVSEGMSRKLGLTVDVVNTNRYADFGSPFRPLSPQELQVGQRLVEEIYHTFVARVEQGRGLTFDQVDAIGQGRVWSGANALPIGLIDELGGLERAIEVAAAKAGLERYRIVELPKLPDPLQLLLESLSGSIRAQMLRNELGQAFRHYQRIMGMVTNPGVVARMPFDLQLR